MDTAKSYDDSSQTSMYMSQLRKRNIVTLNLQMVGKKPMESKIFSEVRQLEPRVKKLIGQQLNLSRIN